MSAQQKSACVSCQSTWYSKGYLVCLSGCDTDRPRTKENSLCHKGCKTKFEKLFSGCVDKIKLPPAERPNCLFGAPSNTNRSLAQTPPKTPRGTWAPKSPSSSARQHLAESPQDDITNGSGTSVTSSPSNSSRGKWTPKSSTPSISVRQRLAEDPAESDGDDATGGSDASVTSPPSRSPRKKWDKTPPIHSLGNEIRKNQDSIKKNQ